ncbi:transmembrane and coiled-coil domains protein 2 isoform X4 [Cherax quadricarinatus]|uniref:transmembrane and coiled-coil domains protein 2 isoform X4 n=1 Tax=Cherax quadricarinatus TaxID=27406 RepID=UPI0023785395|nr:transmembrane and coiled-coil domains protein 1-like isoform X4 [Cherax quadricarinatus]
MLSLGGLPEVPPPQGNHRRSKSDCGLDKRDDVSDLATLNPNYRSTSPTGHLRVHAHTRPNTPIMVRSPSTSSIPEIFISSEDDMGPGVSPVTRLAVFSLADFLETVTHAHHHPRKKCSSSEVSGPGHGGRRRSPLAARKSTPVGGGASAGSGGAAEGNPSISTTTSTTPGGSALAGVAGQSTQHQARTTGSGGGATRLPNAAAHHDDAAVHSSNEDCDAETVPSSGVSNGSGELVDTLRVCGADIGAVDDGEEHTPHVQRTREALEHIQAKIQKTRDLIKEEQKARDENVNEYLKLAGNADRQQIARIKAVFEKKNQKSAALIQQLQKKLENYQKRLREIETHGLIVAHRQPKEVLRDMGQGLNSHHQSSSAQGAGGSSSGGGHHGSKIGSEEGSECNSSITSESVPGGSTTLAHLASPRNHHSQLTSVDFYGLPGGTTVEHLLLELRESREESARLREEIDTIKQALAAEVNSMREGLAEERFRCDRLEEQINDLTELHQNEMGNLVTNMSDMEEKVQYQSEERIRDLHEIVENCHTRISRMEHQQAQQQQQYLTLEGLENSNARAVFVKLINVLLTVLQVLLLVVATVANILTPLLQTRTRLVVTAVLVFLLIFVYIQLPELREMWYAVVDRYLKFVSLK